jgi:RNA polymerase subunit RPABC4/transcription elongation factor Spt4
VTDIIDSLKEGASQVLSNIDQQGHIRSALDGLRSQWNEVERRRKTSQLSAQIKALEGEARQMTEALGLQVLSLHDAGRIEQVELSRLCERINELRAKAEARKAELSALKAEAAPESTKCPHCGATAAAGADYCAACGAEMGSTPPAGAAQDVSASAARTPTGPAPKSVRLRCARCKTILPGEVSYCPTCGAKLKMPEAKAAPGSFCAACGGEVEPGARFCPTCGQATQHGG